MKHFFRLILLLLLLSTCIGCVRRRLTIRSNPPGAAVFVDKQEIGRTPVSTDFLYYGTREIKLVYPGFETLTVQEKISAPWYQIMPLDFVSENLYPREIRDERILDFELEPERITPKEELVDRGTELRSATIAGFTVPTLPHGRPLQDDPESLNSQNGEIPRPFFPDP